MHESLVGTFRTCRDSLTMSASGRNADIYKSFALIASTTDDDNGG